MCPGLEVDVVLEVGAMVTLVAPELGVMVIVVAEVEVMVILVPEVGVMVIVPKVEVLVVP